MQRAVSHAKTNNTCCQWFPPPEAALVLQTILNHSSNRCNTENYRHGFLPITDSSANQLSVPINRQNRLIGLPLNNNVPIIVATDLEVHFSVLKKGVSQYFCLYSVCTSHWCLVMSFWLKVCIYSHTRGVKLGLGLGFMQTSQVLPHWLNQSFSFWTLPYTQRYCHVRIERVLSKLLL